MSAYLLYPRLNADKAESLRRRALASGEAVAFSDAVLSEALDDIKAFPSTGGERIDETRLRQLRQQCLDATQLNSEAVLSTSAFDRCLGRVLYEASERSLGEFGNPAVWDFLALVLMPDIVTYRFAPDTSGSAARYTGANRRHALRRLWRRWRVLGPEVVQADFLTEDDYVALLERNLTSINPQVAVRVANAIRTSELQGSGRREFTRVFMRQLVQASGLVEVGDDDPAHLDALFVHLLEVTKRILDRSE